MRTDLIDRAKVIRAEAEKIDTSHTETVTMADLRVGDVVVAVGPDAIAFPFPFTLSKVDHLDTHGVVMLQASHGWFNMRPFPAVDPVVRVAS